MSIIWGLLTFLHVVTCLFLIIVVLLQSGKGGGTGLAGGASQTMLGTRGNEFLSRLTTIFATIFMAGSLILSLGESYSGSRLGSKADVFNKGVATKLADLPEPTSTPASALSLPTSEASSQPASEASSAPVETPASTPAVTPTAPAVVPPAAPAPAAPVAPKPTTPAPVAPAPAPAPTPAPANP